MAQLGFGGGSHYPSAIDTRQIYQNTASSKPDSDTRIDSECLNDALAAIVQIETALGAGIQGSFASLAARLAALETGSAAPLTNIVPFASETGVLLPGAAHSQGQQALFYAVYDASVPRHLIAPGTFSVYSSSYNAVVTFEASQSGVLMVARLLPQYVTPFSTPGTPPYDVLIPGSTHGLGEPFPLFQAYGTGDPMPVIEVGSLRVNTTTFDVTVSFGAPQTGTLLLAVGTPRYVQSFTNALTVTIPGATHSLGTPNLFAQLYAPGTGENLAIPVGALTVHHATFDVQLAFAAPQSGTLVLVPVPSVMPAAMLATLPPAQTLRMPEMSTRRAALESAQLTALQTSLEHLTTRLTSLETIAEALLQTQQLPPNREEPMP